MDNANEIVNNTINPYIYNSAWQDINVNAINDNDINNINNCIAVILNGANVASLVQYALTELEYRINTYHLNGHIVANWVIDIVRRREVANQIIYNNNDYVIINNFRALIETMGMYELGFMFNQLLNL